MFATLSFLFLSCLFADLVVRRGADALTWLKGAEKTAEVAVKSAEVAVEDTVKKL